LLLLMDSLKGKLSIGYLSKTKTKSKFFKKKKWHGTLCHVTIIDDVALFPHQQHQATWTMCHVTACSDMDKVPRRWRVATWTKGHIVTWRHGHSLHVATGISRQLDQRRVVHVATCSDVNDPHACRKLHVAKKILI